MEMKTVLVDSDHPNVRLYNGRPYFSDGLDGAPIKIGSRVSKRNSQEDDITPDGTEGIVIGSIR